MFVSRQKRNRIEICLMTDVWPVPSGCRGIAAVLFVGRERFVLEWLTDQNGFHVYTEEMVHQELSRFIERWRRLANMISFEVTIDTLMTRLLQTLPVVPRLRYA